jgi:uncharacterized membrane protein YcfT
MIIFEISFLFLIIPFVVTFIVLKFCNINVILFDLFYYLSTSFFDLKHKYIYKRKSNVIVT